MVNKGIQYFLGIVGVFCIALRAETVDLVKITKNGRVAYMDTCTKLEYSFMRSNKEVEKSNIAVPGYMVFPYVSDHSENGLIQETAEYRDMNGNIYRVRSRYGYLVILMHIKH